jgi:hypothetical protein
MFRGPFRNGCHLRKCRRIDPGARHNAYDVGLAECEGSCFVQHDSIDRTERLHGPAAFDNRSALRSPADGPQQGERAFPQRCRKRRRR